MGKQIAALSFIYICVCAAWGILGITVSERTGTQHRSLGVQVERLWGSAQTQTAPVASVITAAPVENKDSKPVSTGLPLDSSKIDVDLKLDQRKKGLLWYPTYKVHFDGNYEVGNTSDEAQHVQIQFPLPSKQGVYDNISLKVNDERLPDVRPENGVITTTMELPAHSKKKFNVAYDSMGVWNWKYSFGSNLPMVRKFSLNMRTDFKDIDFPEGSRSPSEKIRSGKGWGLRWNYDNTMSGYDIGMAMPALLNPGPLVSSVTFFAPVSLFFFFYVMWLSTTLRSIKIHPMNYFFIGAAFFSFHLLLAYSVDHIPLEIAFLICSIVSVGLVVSYISRVVRDQMFVRQVALAQLTYLIFFSYTFFFEQFTGLIITCLSILTLFVSMQYTAKIDWQQLFSGNKITSQDADLALIEEAYGTGTA
ncbi:MAG: cell envelope integrity protein CreD [Candidatus Obscuribacterales bacterium]|jgi:inner membrane protein involved in colicin E2 resistance|nr:cell envelope integrity protein CreD [Candidatus Obscuribacterales bacterium]